MSLILLDSHWSARKCGIGQVSVSQIVLARKPISESNAGGGSDPNVMVNQESMKQLTWHFGAIERSVNMIIVQQINNSIASFPPLAPATDISAFVARYNNNGRKMCESQFVT